MNIKNVDLKAIKFHQEDTNSISGNSEWPCFSYEWYSFGNNNVSLLQILIYF